MKSILVMFTIFSSLNVFAFHPGDGDWIVNVGVGSEILVTSDINIKPKQDFIEIGSVNNATCYLRLKTKVDFDRAIKAGKILKIMSTSMKDNESEYLQQLHLDSDEIQRVSCYSEYGTAPVTIGQLKAIFCTSFALKLAEPKEIN